MQCPICRKSDGFNLVEEWIKYKIYYCHFCNVVFSNPMKNPGPKWYEESEMYTLGRVLHHSIEWYHKQFIQDGKIYGEKLLDVGCGIGVFLKEVQRLGYMVTGIDFDKENVKIAKEQFCVREVFCNTLEEFVSSYPNRKFDIITFFEVLEHIENPNTFVELVKKALKSGGYIALSVPNRERFVDPLGEVDYPPNHLTRWNVRALRSFLENRGFGIVKLIIKKLDFEDVAGCLKAKIKFGIAHRMVQKSKAQHNPVIIHQAAKLMKIKDITFKFIAMPLAFILKPFKLQGTGIYVLARIK